MVEAPKSLDALDSHFVGSSWALPILICKNNPPGLRWMVCRAGFEYLIASTRRTRQESSFAMSDVALLDHSFGEEKSPSIESAVQSMATLASYAFARLL